MATNEISAARIHIVDDDVEFRGMLANYLGGQSMHVRCSGSGADMVRHFTACEPDLILLNVRPSQEDGLDLLRDRAGP